MNHTSKYNEGYRYYVYVVPGVVEYFKDLDDAKEYASGYPDTEVKLLDD